ncbi:MAG: methyl-accepting chemotaxis protein, partial [Chloroflexota bacterium]
MPTKPLSTPASQQSNLEKIEQEQERKEIDHAFRQSSVFKARCSKTLRLSSLTSGSATLVGMALFAILGIVVSSNWLWVLAPCSIMLLGFIVSFSVINPLSHRRIRVGAYIIMLAGLMGIVSFQLLTGALNTILIGYLWVILLAILAGLTVPEIFGIALLVVLVSSSTILAEHIFKFYQPALSINNQPLIQIFVLITMIGAIVAELMMLVQTLYQALIDTELRAKQALLITQHLSQTNQFGKEASLSLNTIVSELNSTSRQQASGAQEQAAAVMEVTSSMSELGETARQIANNSNRVSVAASDGFYSAGRVREATQRAAKTAERGQAAVDSSIQAIEDVRNGITALAERLMTLTERSKQISSIIALIKEIADETHLLALNAAIESAGAGESGRRFSVV